MPQRLPEAFWKLFCRDSNPVRRLPTRFAVLLVSISCLMAGCRSDDVAARDSSAAIAPNRARNQNPAEPFVTVPVPSAAAQDADARTNLVPREVRPGIYQLGDVQINQQARAVSFPAQMNLNQGAMEYFLVTSWGKVHESILRTEADPYQIHIGMLLLGAKGMGTNIDEILDSAYVSNPSSIELPGDKVRMEVQWTSDGKPVRKWAEDLVLNSEKGRTMPTNSWVYTGSLLIETTFLAQRDGSIASLITDIRALINNTGPDHDNQTVWLANSNALPPIDTPVEVTIRLKP